MAAFLLRLGRLHFEITRGEGPLNALSSQHLPPVVDECDRSLLENPGRAAGHPTQKDVRADPPERQAWGRVA